MSRPPEDFFWFWVVKGYKGLHGLANQPLDQGHRPPDDWWKELEEARDEIDKILARK